MSYSCSVFFICSGIFRFLDINFDKFIDLSEMVRGMSLFCRQPLLERVKCECIINYVASYLHDDCNVVRTACTFCSVF